MTAAVGAVEAFRSHWQFVHGMTLAFATEIADEHWEFSPHQRFAPFCKQLRHVVCVRGIYNDALVTGVADFVTGVADFGKKHSYYSGGLTRDELTGALVEKHQALSQALDLVGDDGAEELVIDAFGRQFGFGEFGFVMVHHEAIHQGEWGLYASLAGFETPLSLAAQLGTIVHADVHPR